VVPGPITHPNFKGSHALIRQGAELVTELHDILESYGIMEEKIAAREFAGTPEEKVVFEFLAASAAPQDIDKITEATKLQPHIANQTTSMLFIKGVIKELGNGYVIN
jgi:DNA processing protein